jgi:uncharacterized protein (DUF2062 family)
MPREITMKKIILLALLATEALTTGVARAQAVGVLVQYYPYNGYQMCVYQYPNGALYTVNVGVAGVAACPPTWQ